MVLKVFGFIMVSNNKKESAIMTETVLQTRGLSKLYAGKPAVDKVDMTIQKGDIYGLIGKNGAGKTTLIRMITALIGPSSGEVELFGETTAAGLTNARKRVGCVVETPALYPNLTANENLEYYRILYGMPEKERIKEALELVGLADTGAKKFKNFSLGMKQRLGLALAILGNPDFILLDEPVNGLDPIGIIEMRETLKNLNERHGITILVSSHILTELSQIATRYGIINNGRLVKEITKSQLADECQRCLAVTVDDTEKATVILETVLNTANFKVVGKNEIRIYDYLDNPSEVTFQLNSGGVRVGAIQEIGDNLEDYFKAIVEGDK
jgi:ABC-2 type transport system ATP-binding protein